MKHDESIKICLKKRILKINYDDSHLFICFISKKKNNETLRF
jgi:hypothetical protein